MSFRSFKHFVVRTIWAIALTALLLATVGADDSYGQVAGATRSGTVTDPSCGFIPKAEVTITNVATSVTRTVSTDSAGFYSAPNLSPGDYQVTTTSPGFATRVQTGITLTVGAQQVLNYTLQVGQLSEKVQVSSEAPAVQLASSTISDTVDPTTVRELPL